MTIKVFTAPPRTPQFEIWRLGSPPAYTASQRCRYLASSFSPFCRFQSPLSPSRLRFSFFRYSFPRVSCIHVYLRWSVARWKKAASPIPRFSILFTTPVLHVAPAITRSGSANARACRQIGGNCTRTS